MNAVESGKGCFQDIPPITKSISKALRHTYKAICHISRALISIVYEIQEIAKNTFMYLLSNAKKLPSKLDEKSITIISIKENEKNIADLSVKEDEAKIESLAKEKVLIQEKLILPPSELAIDVPDDGNCLFYALSIGLKKKFDSFFLVQNEEKWNVDPNELRDDLSKAGELLHQPAAFLRNKAANYLEEHLEDESIINALFEGIDSHKESIQKKIKDEFSAKTILINDLKYLISRNLEDSDTWHQVMQKVAHIDVKNRSIEFEKKQLPKNDDDFLSYINATRQDKVYAGIPQIYALSFLYDISIRVCYNYGNDQKYEQIFNEKISKEEPSNEINEFPFDDKNEKESKNEKITPIISLAFVNGNHFRYIDD
ncbi:MAG: hypothetical protein H0W50_01440 [Parachlamydiaceae bacterium]|nr:hypothetical protein [Parachlamydiaceae bacterium]